MDGGRNIVSRDRKMLYPVWESNRCGYIDGGGRLVLGFDYEDGRIPADGVIPVKQGGSWALADYHGNLRFDPIYDYIWRPSEGFCSARRKGGRDGFYINYEGIEVFDLGSFEEMDSFSCGRAQVRSKGRYSFIDPEGQSVFFTDKYYIVNSFENGVASVAIRVQNKNLFGAIDTSGSEVVPLASSLPVDFSSDGFCVVCWAANGLSEVLDRSGEVVFRPAPDRRLDLVAYDAGLVYAENLDSNRGYFLDVHGKVMSSSIYDCEPHLSTCGGFGSGLVPATSRHDERMGYLNADGIVAIPLDFLVCDKFNDSRAVVILECPDGDLPALLDTEGRFVIEPSPENQAITWCGGEVWRVDKTSSEEWYYSKSGDLLWVSDGRRESAGPDVH